MKNKILIGLLILLGVLFVLDISIRLFYCSGISLQFNSQEFNNIGSPIISLLGFAGLVLTIILSTSQLKHQQGLPYFEFYKKYIDDMAQSRLGDASTGFSTLELLGFIKYGRKIYQRIRENPEYIHDQKAYEGGAEVINAGKMYDNALGTARLFSAYLDILLKRYRSTIAEIVENKFLDRSQQDLLLKHLFETQVDKYYYGCVILNTNPDLKEVRENLYLAFDSNVKYKLFFNENFFALYHRIENDPRLKKLMEVKTG